MSINKAVVHLCSAKCCIRKTRLQKPLISSEKCKIKKSDPVTKKTRMPYKKKGLQTMKFKLEN